MSRKERNKIILDFIKALVIALLSAIFGIFGFLVINLSSVELMQVVFALIGAFVVILAIVLIIKYAFVLLKEIEKDVS